MVTILVMTQMTHSMTQNDAFVIVTIFVITLRVIPHFAGMTHFVVCRILRNISLILQQLAAFCGISNFALRSSSGPIRR